MLLLLEVPVRGIISILSKLPSGSKFRIGISTDYSIISSHFPSLTLNTHSSCQSVGLLRNPTPPLDYLFIKERDRYQAN